MKSLVFAGALIGQLTMGTLGDVAGRRTALLTTNTLIVIGSIGTGLFTWGDSATFYGIMMAFRFILGVGVGGNYPLAAAVSSESGANKNASKSVGITFFWRSPAFFLPYLMGLLFCVGNGNLESHYMFESDWAFRTVMWAGAIPAAIVVILTAMTPENKTFKDAKAKSKGLK